MRARDVDFKQMEEQLNQLVFYREAELVSESGNGKSTVEELNSFVSRWIITKADTDSFCGFFQT
ncbi:unnamed protein product, partial [Brassica oleracea var. botrytis]